MRLQLQLPPPQLELQQHCKRALLRRLHRVCCTRPAAPEAFAHKEVRRL